MQRDIEKLIVLGPPGSYLDGLAKSMDLGCPIGYGEAFPEMIAEAAESPETAALLPIKNSLNGTLYDVVGELQGGRLMVEAAVKLDVVSNIMGLGELDEARSIAGKDVALQQITRFMPQLKRVVMSSTSAAGQHIAETGDKTMLAVGAKAQAELYGLKVLAESAQDQDGLNRTTVLLVRGRNGRRLDPKDFDTDTDLAGTAIMRVESSEEAGSLYNALGEMAARNINLTNIESLNVRGTEASEFFLTLSGSSEAIIDLTTSEEVAKQMSLGILGLYPEPPVYSS
jgi:prephenate dehydratase